VGNFLDAPLVKALRDVNATLNAIVALGGLTLLSWGFLSHFKIAVISTGAAAIVFATTWYWATRYYEPAPYVISSLETVLLVERKGNHHKCTRTKILDITARRNNLRLIEFRLKWTGVASAGFIGPLEALDPDHTAFTAPREDEDRILHSWVYLGQSLQKGQKARVHVVQIFEDDQQPMQRFHYDGGAAFKVKKIKVVTRFPSNEEPGSVTGHTWNINQKLNKPKQVGGQDVRRLNDKGLDYVDFIVEPKRIRRYRGYGVRWRN
jgi:hypothetical protein